MRALFFDLDGTLVDTAPDMLAALRAVASTEGRSIDAVALRPLVSAGSAALIAAVFSDFSEKEQARLRENFLQAYAACLLPEAAFQSRVFPGMETVLQALQKRALPWGIVTNKPERFTYPLLERLALYPHVVVAGDTLASKKPDPAPLLYACSALSVEPQHALYIGDDPRDVQAARAAGMPVVVAGFGYLPPGEDASTWGADALLYRPEELLRWI